MQVIMASFIMPPYTLYTTLKMQQPLFNNFLYLIYKADIQNYTLALCIPITFTLTSITSNPVIFSIASLTLSCIF